MMKRIFKCLLLPAVILTTFLNTARSQVLVESVAAIVGNEVIYLSELESLVADARRNNPRLSADNARCDYFQQMLVSKLFLDQARIDSISVTEDAVEGEVNARLNNAIMQAGSEQALESYFKKNMIEIRRDIKKSLLEQETVSEVQNKIAENVKVTPAALKKYYNSIPKDSLPVVPAKYEISIIQVDPPFAEDNKAEARQKLLDIRSRILAGTSFSALAMAYSEDTETARKGGEVGYLPRNMLEKEYADVAFSLTKNTVSRIVETKYGFHIIQLIDKKGDMVNTRHILIRPKVKPNQAQAAITRLDSIANKIREDSIKFETAAIRLSTHKDSKINGGKLVSANPSDRTTWFTLEELSPEMYRVVRDLKVGEISEPFRSTDENNNEVFRIIRLDKMLPAHSANLKDDYQSLYDASLQKERNEIFEKWIKNKIDVTYIKISDEFKSCEFLKEGWLK
ncbi:MAG TPA: peptidylprolyl isomerase [Bacteroidales bacterium]|nr:peptidylprolyl isomerase [Bacteroidales bacterium]